MAGRRTVHRTWTGWVAVVVAAVLAVPLVPAAPAAAASSGGTVYVWGIGLAGQMGNGAFGSAVPIALRDVDGIVFTDIDIGTNFDLALTDGGTIYGWGQNADGQLGRGTMTPSERTPEPVTVPDGVTFTTVAAGYFHSLALAHDGVAYSWGQNAFGQLGDSGLENRSTPGPVVMPEGVSFVAVAGGQDASVAVADDGTVYTWGANDAGQLGDGTVAGRLPIPARATMPDGVRFTAVSAGSQYAMALAADGTVYTWGYNRWGQLGNGTTGGFDATPAPVVMPDGVRFTAISAGRQFAMALAADGTVYTWGFNGWGQLGNGTTGGTNPTPAAIEMPAETTFAAIDGGSSVASALTPDGALYIWGRNANRLFGDGTTSVNTIRNIPGQTTPPDGGAFGAMAMTSGSMANAGLTGLPADVVAAHHGDGQEVHVHQPFPDPLQVRVTTYTGHPVPGVPVTFTINSPATFDGGAASAVAPTGDDGVATSPPLVATGETGTVEVTATVPGIVQAPTFTLTVLPAPPEPPPAEQPGTPPMGPSPGSVPPHAPGEPDGGGLPDTGNRAGWLLTLGAVLAAAGVLLLTLSSRPRVPCQPRPAGRHDGTVGAGL